MQLILQELPKGKWFCCMDCSRIHSVLQKLLVHEAELLPDSQLDAIRKKYIDKGLETVGDIDVRWRLLSGKTVTPETRFLLSQAVAIFHVSIGCDVFRSSILRPLAVALYNVIMPTIVQICKLNLTLFLSFKSKQDTLRLEFSCI